MLTFKFNKCLNAYSALGIFIINRNCKERNCNQQRCNRLLIKIKLMFGAALGQVRLGWFSTFSK